MALSREDSLRLYGTEAYTAWDEASAAADAQSKGIQTQSYSGGGFNFDFAGEAEKAYGELGTYYDRLLKENDFDVNKALSRLSYDYDTNTRQARQDYFIQEKQMKTAQEQQNKALITEGLRRGITRGSAYDTQGKDMLGIFGAKKKQLGELQAMDTQQLSTSLDRYLKGAELSKQRSTEDINTQAERYKSELERNRRKEAGELANLRGQTAFQNYSSSLV